MRGIPRYSLRSLLIAVGAAAVVLGARQHTMYLLRQEWEAERALRRAVDRLGGGVERRSYSSWLSRVLLVPSEYSRRVVSVDLTGCLSGDDDLPDLQSAIRLRELVLADNRITDEAIARLPQLGELESLTLSNTLVGDSTAGRLRHFPRLRTLNLGYTQVGDDGLAELSRCTTLRHVHLSDTPVTDEGVRLLSRLQSLRAISLGRTSVGNGGVYYLARLRSLEVLDLSGTAITDEALLHMRPLHRLRELYLQNISVTDRYSWCLREFPQLEVLWMGDVNDACLMDVATIPSLRSLEIHGRHVTDAGLHHLQRAKRLELISIGSSTVVSQDGVCRLKMVLPRLYVDGGKQ